MWCTKTLSKWFLIIFNIIFFILGIAIMSIGIAVLADGSLILKALSYVPTNSVLDAATIDNIVTTSTFLESTAGAIVFLGVLVLIIGFCGCCGAWKEVKFLLYIYGGAVLIIFIGEITCGALAYVYQADVITYLKNYLSGTIEFNYDGGHIDSAGTIVASTGIISQAWDILQVQFTCCGVDNVTDYVAATAWNKTYDLSGVTFDAVVPATCCQLTGASTFPSGLDGISFVNETTCLGTADAASTNVLGCYDSVYSMINKYIIYIGAGGIVIAMIEVFGILAAFCFIYAIRKGDEEESQSLNK